MTIPFRTITLRPRPAALAAATPVALLAAGLVMAASNASPAAASTATTSLTALRPAASSNGWGPVEVDRSVNGKGPHDGHTLTINGAKFAHGLGTHAWSHVRYNLNRKYDTFSTYIGVDDEVGSRGSVRFKVLRDGKVAYTSPVMTGRDGARYVSVSVANTSSLTLVVNPVGTTAYAHADWASPTLSTHKVRKPQVTSTATATSPTPSTTTSPVSTTTTTASPPPTTTTGTTPPAPSTTTAPPSTTPPAPSTTTQAPTPVSSSAFPDSSNTGVPAGTTLTPSGDLTLSTPGQVVSGLNVSGRIYITANNVTVQRSRITTNGYNVIEIADGVTGVTIQDVEIDGMGASGASGSNGIYGPAKVLRANIHGVENGIQPESGSVVQDSYIHAMVAPGDPHYDGIQIDGARSNIVLRHNTVDMRGLTQTSAVMIDNYFGPISNIAVDQNKLLGAGYVVYSDGRFSGGTISGVSFTNNRLGDGYWGYASIDVYNPVWSGNVDNTTGAVIPQP